MNTLAERMGIELNELGLNELAENALSDGQAVRPFWNYFALTYQNIKGKRFEMEEIEFNDRIEFYRHLQGVLEMMIDLETQERLDNPEMD